jgi:plasmid stabilization system protein ParE
MSDSIRIIFTYLGPRKAGKPPAAARARRRAIADYVHRLRQQAESGKLDSEIVPKAAAHFGISVRSVWNALRRIKFDISYSGRFYPDQ